MPYRDYVNPVVEVAFGYGPYDDPPSGAWVDISSYVHSVRYERGSRTSEFDQFNAGTMTVTLDNSDRRFDPLNLSGPYIQKAYGPVYPNVEASATKVGTSLGLSNPMNMPAGIQPGELLIAVVVQDSTTAMTVPGGENWQQIFQADGPSGAFRYACWAKLAVGADTLTVSGATEDFCCVVSRVAKHSVVSADIASQILGNPAIFGGNSGTSANTSTSSNLGAIPALGIAGEGRARFSYMAYTLFDDDDSTSFSMAGKVQTERTDPGEGVQLTQIAFLESASSIDSVSLQAGWRKIETPPQNTGTFEVTTDNVGVEEWVAFILRIPPALTDVTQLVPDVPIRVQADVGASTVDVWRGVVDAWPVGYSEAGIESVTSVQCTDAFKTLGDRPLGDQARNSLELLGEDSTWFKMDKLVDSLYFPNDFGDEPKLTMTQCKAVEVDPITAIADKSFLFPEIRNGDVRAPGPPVFSGIQFTGQAGIYVPKSGLPFNLVGGSSWTMQIALQALRSVPAGNTWTLWHYHVPPFGNHADEGGAYLFMNGGRVDTLAIYINPGVNQAVITPEYDSTQPGAVPEINILDGNRHLVDIVRNGNTIAIYVDDIQLGAATGLGSAVWSAEQVVGSHHDFLSSKWSGGVATSDVPPTVLGSVIFTQAAARIGREFIFNPQPPVLAGEAIIDILDLIGWPAGLRAIDPGTQLISLPTQLNNESALSILQRIVLTENGRLFVGGDGKITFHDRYRAFSNTLETSVQYTFSDMPGADVGIQDEALNWTLDDSFVYTSAEVTRAGGQTRRISYEESPRRTRKIDGLLFYLDSQSQSLADWIVHRYQSPQPRTESWGVDPQTLTADWLDILNLNIGTRVLLDITPGNQGSSLDLEQIIEQISGEITPEEWSLKFNGVPVDPNNYFLWTTSETSDEEHGWSADGLPPGGFWA